ncbi:hypothetical protein ACSBR1_030109 [Camellia fascicularis]
MNMEPENDCAWKPKQGKTFDSEQCVYDFYNTYGGRMGFSIRRNFCRKNKVTNQLICRLLVCNKEGFRKADKRDPLSKNPRAETRTGCEARLYIKLDKGTGKYVVTDFKEKHNHDLVSPECAHMLPSQRKISTTQAIQLDLAAQSGLRLGQSFELMGREAGGRQCLGFTKLDSKNYLRTKRQQSLAYGEVGNVLQYFKEKSLQNPSFFYAFQLDNEEQITNMFWADAQMIMDYAQFGDLKGNDIQVDVKFQQASQYKTLMTAFRALASRAAETEETYDFCIAHLATLGANVEGKLSAHFGVGNEVINDDDIESVEVDCEDVNHVVQPKGLKKKMATSKGKRRVKGGFEAALVTNSKKKSRANSLASSQSIASPTVSPSPLAVGGDIYVWQHVPPLQPLPPIHPLPPSLAMGGNSIPPPLMYPTCHTNNLREMYVLQNSLPNPIPQRYSSQPTFQSLLQGSCGYDIGFRYSQESNSPMCSQLHSEYGSSILTMVADMLDLIIDNRSGHLLLKMVIDNRSGH